MYLFRHHLFCFTSNVYSYCYIVKGILKIYGLTVFRNAIVKRLLVPCYGGEIQLIDDML